LSVSEENIDEDRFTGRDFFFRAAIQKRTAGKGEPQVHPQR
jgi:hypothetical protein